MSEFSDLGRILVIVPTYNERENIPRVIDRIRTSRSEVDVLIVDDNSPDGTGDIADELATDDAQVHVLHRRSKDGLGAAYLEGFDWGLERGYDVLVEMDADGSHQPEQLHQLLAALREADLVIGSRWVPGGSVVNWPKSREALSRGANWYTRIMLNLPLLDATGGYRAFRAQTLRKIGLDGVGSAGYIFQVDLAYRAARLGLTVKEVPIEFVERESGTSKMDRSVVSEALWRVTAWGVRDHTRRISQWHNERRATKAHRRR